MTSSFTLARTLLRDGKFVLISTLLERLTFFVVFLVIARNSAPAVYGSVTAIFVFCNLLQTLFDLGLPAYFQREYSSPGTTHPEELSSVLWFKLLMLFPFLIITLLYFLIEPASELMFVIVIACVVFGLGLANLLNGVLYGKARYRVSLTIQFSGRIGLLVLVPLLALLRAPISTLLLLLLCSVVVQVALLLRSARTGELRLFGNLNFRTLSNILRPSVPIGIGLFLVAVYDRIDVLFIQKLVSLDAVAMYAVAYSLYRLPLIVSAVIVAPAYTTFSGQFASHGSIDARSIRTTVVVQSALAVIAGLILCAAPSIWLTILYGERYSSSATILICLAFALPAIFLNNLTGVLLNAMRKERLPLKSTALGAIVNVGMNSVLIPLLGILGAAVATIATEYSVLAAEGIYLWRNRNLISVTPTSEILVAPGTDRPLHR